jgi:hypothetical protein
MQLCSLVEEKKTSKKKKRQSSCDSYVLGGREGEREEAVKLA